MTNDPERNEVVMFDRLADGALVRVGAFPTEGRGSGCTADPLTANYELVLTQDNSLLLAVYAGTSTITVFRVRERYLQLLSVTRIKGGASPYSIAIHDDLVYVGDLGGSYGLEGFRLDKRTGELPPIPNSFTSLSGLVGSVPDALRFSPDGRKLVVTERPTQKIDVFSVSPDGHIYDTVYNPPFSQSPLGSHLHREAPYCLLKQQGFAKR